MLPKHENLILRDKVLLYNNLASLNNCNGRLLAELQIFPSICLNFEFEILGESSYPLPSIFAPRDTTEQIIGHIFLLKNLAFNRERSDIGPQKVLSGISGEANYNNIDSKAHFFEFYLPNCRIQYTSGGQINLNKRVEESNTGKEVSWELGGEGRRVEISLDNNWSIRLEIDKKSLKWLNPNTQNTGTFITTSGKLYQPKYDATKPETFTKLEEVTTQEALKNINYLSLLLSFANGGFLSPLYLKSSKFYLDSDPIRPQSACVIPSRITPIEQLGITWVTNNSNLSVYLSCLNSFKKMQQNKYWQDTFKFALIQYFQAVQTYTYWPIQASALGAALERLSYTLLVEEESNSQLRADHELLFEIRKKDKAKSRWKDLKYKKTDDKFLSVTGIRLSLILEKIGLINDLNPDQIQTFLDIRNDAVHPKQGGISPEQRDEVLSRAIMWVDEILLWRLGYDGQYFDRLEHWLTSISPRYDLTKRDPSW